MFKIGSQFPDTSFVLNCETPRLPEIGELVAVCGHFLDFWEIARTVSICPRTHRPVVLKLNGFIVAAEHWRPLEAQYSPLIPEVGEYIRVSSDDPTLEAYIERKFISITEDGAGVVCEHAIPGAGDFTWAYWERIPPAAEDTADKDSVAFANALASGNIDELINYLNSAKANFESAERKLESGFSKEDVALLTAFEDALFHALLSGSDDDGGEDDLSTFEGAVAALNREGRIERVEFSDNDNTYSCSKETWNESDIAAAKSSLEAKRARDAALAKLTAAERTLLGLDD